MTDINKMLDMDVKPMLSRAEKADLMMLAAGLHLAESETPNVTLLLAPDMAGVLKLVILAGLEAIENDH